METRALELTNALSCIGSGLGQDLITAEVAKYPAYSLAGLPGEIGLSIVIVSQPAPILPICVHDKNM